MKVLVTGAHGFLGRNCSVRLRELKHKVVPVGRNDDISQVVSSNPEIDAVVHLAAVNRSSVDADFDAVNVGVTQRLVDALSHLQRNVTVVFSSTTHVTRDTVYARSKRGAEVALESYARETGASAGVIRFPNVFGKWSRPNYNSAIATFCHNLARGLPIKVHDEDHELTLCYVDDAVDDLIAAITGPPTGYRCLSPTKTYSATVGQIAATLRGIASTLHSVNVGSVGEGLERALYATYLSFIPEPQFDFPLQRHEDPRGAFVEFVRTPSAGQMSFFTAKPGVMRGSHYHHTKNERFLVLKGRAQFRFRCLASTRQYEITVDDQDSRVVQTIPGWVHDITNVGDDDLLVMLWANENFDPDHPDTVAEAV
ncbi:MAG: NAD-dependent epimerase/dehydratase family protein [Pseudomonadota bacterium]